MEDNREQWRIDAEKEWRAAHQRKRARKQEHRKRRRKRQHDGKDKLTKEDAFVTMHRIAFETGHWISAYPCEFCEWWHVGNIQKRIEVERVEAQGHELPKQRATKKPPMTNNIGDLFGDLLREFIAEEK